jgi:GTP-binding protein HflX
MFATLDPTVRAVRLPSNRRALFSDTVGLIRDLPKPLLAAFRATLEEVQQASLILHVSDISNPHQTEHDADVEKVLSDLGVESRPRLRVFNKIDRLEPDALAALKTPQTPESRERPEAQEKLIRGNGNVYVSALAGAGLDELLRRVDEAMPVDPLVRLHFAVPLADGRTIALVHGLGRVLHSEVSDGEMQLDAELPESLARRLRLDTAQRVAEPSETPRPEDSKIESRK